jgi:hypothetical protein
MMPTGHIDGFKVGDQIGTTIEPAAGNQQPFFCPYE